MDHYGVTPGGLKTKVSIADWLLYSCQELGNLLRMRNEMKTVRELRARIKYGIRKELLKLVKIRGIGRVRARRLYKAGFKNVSSLKKASPERLGELLGPKTAKKIMEQIGTKKKKSQKKLN